MKITIPIVKSKEEDVPILPTFVSEVEAKEEENRTLSSASTKYDEEKGIDDRKSIVVEPKKSKIDSKKGLTAKKIATLCSFITAFLLLTMMVSFMMGLMNYHDNLREWNIKSHRVLSNYHDDLRQWIIETHKNQSIFHEELLEFVNELKDEVDSLKGFHNEENPSEITKYEDLPTQSSSGIYDSEEVEDFFKGMGIQDVQRYGIQRTAYPDQDGDDDDDDDDDDYPITNNQS